LRDESTSEESRSVLTAAEIATTTASDAYEAIAMRRPHFLRPRPLRRMGEPTATGSQEYPVVYMDGLFLGEIASLHGFQISLIDEIRYVESFEAVMRFGRDRTGGVIMIITKIPRSDE
jgi:hypothetical protein